MTRSRPPAAVCLSQALGARQPREARGQFGRVPAREHLPTSAGRRVDRDGGARDAERLGEDARAVRVGTAFDGGGGDGDTQGVPVHGAHLGVPRARRHVDPEADACRPALDGKALARLAQDPEPESVLAPGSLSERGAVARVRFGRELVR